MAHFWPIRFCLILLLYHFTHSRAQVAIVDSSGKNYVDAPAVGSTSSMTSSYEGQILDIFAALSTASGGGGTGGGAVAGAAIPINSSITHDNLNIVSVAATVASLASSASRTCCTAYKRCFDLAGDFFSLLRRPVNLAPNCNVEVGFLFNTRRLVSFQAVIFRSIDDEQTLMRALTVLGDFDARRKATIFLVHGFHSYADGAYFRELKDALLERADVNIFRVNWERGAGMPYTQATANARVVGTIIGLFIERLVRLFALSPRRIHIIGHSLGAHIAGYAARELSELVNRPMTAAAAPTTLRDLLAQALLSRESRIGRITALDAASPFFSGLPASVRLDRSDAEFVEAIHTDTTNFGIAEPIGHVDYYPNGGSEQPGCSDSYFRAAWTTIANFSVTAGRDELSCSHVRAILLYVEMIRNGGGSRNNNLMPYYQEQQRLSRQVKFRSIDDDEIVVVSGVDSTTPTISTTTRPTATVSNSATFSLRKPTAVYKRKFKTGRPPSPPPPLPVLASIPPPLPTPVIVPQYFQQQQQQCNFVAFQCDTYKNFLAAKCVDCSLSPDRCIFMTNYDVIDFRSPPVAATAAAAAQPWRSYFFTTGAAPATAFSPFAGPTGGLCVYQIIVTIELAMHHDKQQEALVSVRLHYSTQFDDDWMTLNDDDDVVFRAGQARTFVIGSRLPLHLITGISMRWSNTRSRLNPIRFTYALFGYDVPNVILVKSVALLSAAEPTSEGHVSAASLRARSGSNGGTIEAGLIKVRENEVMLVPLVGWYSID